MTESTITPEQQQAITDLLAKIPHLSEGVGDKEAPGSITAINLALEGCPTDRIPECMSNAVGYWIRVAQDRAPSELCRDNPRWRELLPLVAGTGRELEAERLQLIIDWMWDILALPAVVAYVPDKAKHAWGVMLEERTVDAARAAHSVAYASADYAGVIVANAAYHAADVVAAYAGGAAGASSLAVTAAATVPLAVTHAAAFAIAHAAAFAVAYVAGVAGVPGPDPWPDVDPIGLLERLIKIEANDD